MERWGDGALGLPISPMLQRPNAPMPSYQHLSIVVKKRTELLTTYLAQLIAPGKTAINCLTTNPKHEIYVENPRKSAATI